MSLDPLLLEILVCPEDKEPMWYLKDEETLYNPRLHRRYLVKDGIPVLLLSEAETVDDDEHARLASAHADHGLTTGTQPASS